MGDVVIVKPKRHWDMCLMGLPSKFICFSSNTLPLGNYWSIRDACGIGCLPHLKT
jgi:hypothetical protein